MNKILVIATGWHFSSHFYENMIKQIVPKGWEVDYFCVAHRLPEDDNTVQEKEDARNLDGDNFLQKISLVQSDDDPSITQDETNYQIHLDNLKWSSRYKMQD